MRILFISLSFIVAVYGASLDGNLQRLSWSSNSQFSQNDWLTIGQANGWLSDICYRCSQGDFASKIVAKPSGPVKPINLDSKVVSQTVIRPVPVNTQTGQAVSAKLVGQPKQIAAAPVVRVHQVRQEQYTPAQNGPIVRVHEIRQEQPRPVQNVQVVRTQEVRKEQPKPVQSGQVARVSEVRQENSRPVQNVQVLRTQEVRREQPKPVQSGQIRMPEVPREHSRPIQSGQVVRTQEVRQEQPKPVQNVQVKLVENKPVRTEVHQQQVVRQQPTVQKVQESQQVARPQNNGISNVQVRNTHQDQPKPVQNGQVVRVQEVRREQVRPAQNGQVHVVRTQEVRQEQPKPVQSVQVKQVENKQVRTETRQQPEVQKVVRLHEARQEQPKLAQKVQVKPVENKPVRTETHQQVVRQQPAVPKIEQVQRPQQAVKQKNNGNSNVQVRLTEQTRQQPKPVQNGPTVRVHEVHQEQVRPAQSVRAQEVRQEQSKSVQNSQTAQIQQVRKEQPKPVQNVQVVRIPLVRQEQPKPVQDGQVVRVQKVRQEQPKAVQSGQVRPAENKQVRTESHQQVARQQPEVRRVVRVQESQQVVRPQNNGNSNVQVRVTEQVRQPEPQAAVKRTAQNGAVQVEQTETARPVQQVRVQEVRQPIQVISQIKVNQGKDAQTRPAPAVVARQNHQVQQVVKVEQVVRQPSQNNGQVQVKHVQHQQRPVQTLAPVQPRQQEVKNQSPNNGFVKTVQQVEQRPVIAKPVSQANGQNQVRVTQAVVQQQQPIRTQPSLGGAANVRVVEQQQPVNRVQVQQQQVKNNAQNRQNIVQVAENVQQKSPITAPVRGQQEPREQVVIRRTESVVEQRPVRNAPINNQQQQVKTQGQGAVQNNVRPVENLVQRRPVNQIPTFGQQTIRNVVNRVPNQQAPVRTVEEVRVQQTKPVQSSFVSQVVSRPVANNQNVQVVTRPLQPGPVRATEHIQIKHDNQQTVATRPVVRIPEQVQQERPRVSQVHNIPQQQVVKVSENVRPVPSHQAKPIVQVQHTVQQRPVQQTSQAGVVQRQPQQPLAPVRQGFTETRTANIPVQAGNFPAKSTDNRVQQPANNGRSQMNWQQQQQQAQIPRPQIVEQRPVTKPVELVPIERRTEQQSMPVQIPVNRQTVEQFAQQRQNGGRMQFTTQIQAPFNRFQQQVPRAAQNSRWTQQSSAPQQQQQASWKWSPGNGQVPEPVSVRSVQPASESRIGSLLSGASDGDDLFSYLPSYLKRCVLALRGWLASSGITDSQSSSWSQQSNVDQSAMQLGGGNGRTMQRRPLNGVMSSQARNRQRSSYQQPSFVSNEEDELPTISLNLA